MDADELVRIQSLLERGNRLQQQMTSARNVKAHVIALRINAVHFIGTHAQQFGTVRDPEFRNPRLLAFAILSRSTAAARHGTRDRTLKPVLRHGLEDVIDRVEIESLDREAVMRGDEDHGRALRRIGHDLDDAARDRQSVGLGHGHVEQHQLRPQRIDHAQGRGAIAGRAHDAQAIEPRADDLHAFDRQWLVVDDQRR